MPTTKTTIRVLEPLEKIKSKTKSIEEISKFTSNNFFGKPHKTYSSLNDLHIHSFTKNINNDNKEIDDGDHFENENKNSLYKKITNDNNCNDNFKNLGNNLKNQNNVMLNNGSFNSFNLKTKMGTKYTKKIIANFDKNTKNKQDKKCDYIKVESDKFQDAANSNQIRQKDSQNLSQALIIRNKMEKDSNVLGDREMYKSYKTGDNNENCVLELNGRRQNKQNIENAAIEINHGNENDILYHTKLNISYDKQEKSEMFSGLEAALNLVEPSSNRLFEVQLSNINVFKKESVKVNSFNFNSKSVNTSCDTLIIYDVDSSLNDNSVIIHNTDQKIETPPSSTSLSKSLQCFKQSTTSPNRLYYPPKDISSILTSSSGLLINKTLDTLNFLPSKITDKTETIKDHSQKLALLPESENYSNLLKQSNILTEKSASDHSKPPSSCSNLFSIKNNFQISDQNEYSSKMVSPTRMAIDNMSKNRNFFTNNICNNFINNNEKIKDQTGIENTENNESYICFDNENDFSSYTQNNLNTYEKHIIVSTCAPPKATKTTCTSNNIFLAPLQCNFQNVSFQQHNYDKSNNLINENIANVTFNQNFSNVSLWQASNPHQFDQSNLPQTTLQQLQLPLKIPAEQEQLNKVLINSFQKLNDESYSKQNSFDQLSNFNSIVTSFNEPNTWTQKTVTKQTLNQKPEISTFDIPKKSFNTTECVYVPSSEHVAEIVGRQGCKIKALRSKTNTYIKTPVRGDEPVFLVTGRKEDVMQAKKEIMLAADHFTQIRVNRKTPNSNSQKNEFKGEKYMEDCEKIREITKNKKENKTEKSLLVKNFYEKIGNNDLYKSINDKGNNVDCGYFSNTGSLKSSDSSYESMSLSPNASNLSTPIINTCSVPLTSNASDDDFKANHIWSKDSSFSDKNIYTTKSSILYKNNNSIKNNNNNSNNNNNNKSNIKTNNPTSLLQKHQITKEVRVPFKVVGLVVGPKGATIKRIQESTHTYIVTPGRDREPVFEIIGCPENVQKAKKEIESYISLRTKSLFSNSLEKSYAVFESNKSCGNNILMFGEEEITSNEDLNYSNYLYERMNDKLNNIINYGEIDSSNYLKPLDYNYQSFSKMANFMADLQNIPNTNNDNDNRLVKNENIKNMVIFNDDCINNTKNNIDPKSLIDDNVCTSKFGELINANIYNIQGNAFKVNNIHDASTNITHVLSTLSSENQNYSKNLIAPHHVITPNEDSNSKTPEENKPYVYYCSNSSNYGECISDM